MPRASDAGGTDVLACPHVGDLRLTTPDAENHRDLGRIAAPANAIAPGSRNGRTW